jgi:glyoxylase-like metal-dependent hydrolase (beta-lactamase superfamily II)
VFWLGDCLEQLHEGRMLHGYNSTYLVCGERSSLLVEAGHPQDLPVVEAQLEGLIAAGVPPLRHVFTTHQETPHAGGLGRVLERFPEAEAVGDVRDFHLIFPGQAGRFRALAPGEGIDLGGTSFQVVASVIHDLRTTQWGFDTRRRVLFPGDGFAYSHYHHDGHCGRTAEEAPSLDLPDMTALFAEQALYWTRFRDMAPFIERLEDLLWRELEVDLVAPTHGLPITDLHTTLPKILEGLRLGSTRA